MTLRNWSLLRWAVAALGLAASALVIGVPTGIIDTPWYTRMTPVLWWNYPVWAATAVVSGLILATYVRTDAHSTRPSRLGMGGNVLSLLAVGCPVCNKLVVMAVGASGALTMWAPLQPVLGVASLGLLGWALWRRLRGERECALTSTGDVAETVR
jgi:hypothetical protein